MPLLVDGHNLIGQLPQLRLSDQDDEFQLVLLLRSYATQKRGRRVVVIFDGGVRGHPANLNGYGVECHFAFAPRDADAELIKRIRAMKQKGEWQVVTSDRAVAGEARVRGIPVISAQEFARRLQTAPNPQTSLREKQSDRPLSPEEIKEWLRLFGIDEGEAEA